MNLKVRKTRNGKIVAWTDNGKAYIVNRYFPKLKAYFWEHGYRSFMIV